MKVKASAPGKTILVGEHFVVENEPAIATAINLRAYVVAEERNDDVIEIISDNLNLREVFAEGSENRNSPYIPYIMLLDILWREQDSVKA